MKRTLLGLALAIGVLSAAIMVAGPLEWRLKFEPEGDRSALVSLSHHDAQAQTAEEGIESLRSQSQAFVQIAKTVLPSVVSINCERTISPTGGRPGTPFFGDELFERFFDRMPEEGFQQRGSGSGVIVSQDGYILTNNHVVANADEITVVLEDDREFKAELVGRDDKSDVAVIRIESTNLVAAKLGDSDQLEVGEWVLAVGNPFQLSSSVTAGIVSATGRSNLNLAEYEDFIQTDAAINPGNSGGALVNLEGEVVGVNSAIATRSGGYQGIGFAIPINMARHIMDSLIENGHVVRGWLGVNIQNVNEASADYLGLDKPNGALVNNVVEDSPAARSGLQQGDVIVELNGRPVKDVRDLQFQIIGMDPGSKVQLTVLRNRDRKVIEATLDEMGGDEETSVDRNEVDRDPVSPRAKDLGLVLEDLTVRWRRELDLPANADGAIVVDVRRTGPAARAGFRAGDVIVKIGDRPVESARDVESALKALEPGESTLLLVERGGTEIFLALRVPE